MVDVQDRHPVDRAALVVPGVGVRDVVGADHERDVGAWELLVRLVHLVELRIGDVRLGEQDVHVTRHPAGDGMDRVADLDAALLEQVGQLAHVVLGLRHGHPVSGYEDDLVRVGQHDGDVVGARRADGAAVGIGCRSRGARADLAERAEQDVGDRAVHRPAHEHREQRSGGADEHPTHDQHVVLELESGRGRGEAGERVQQ